MRHKTGRFCHGEGIAGIGRYLRSVLGPHDEVVACGWCSREGASLAVIVCSCPGNCAAVVWIGGGIDGEALQLEMCYKTSRFRYGKRIGCAG